LQRNDGKVAAHAMGFGFGCKGITAQAMEFSFGVKEMTAPEIAQASFSFETEIDVESVQTKEFPPNRQSRQRLSFETSSHTACLTEGLLIC